MKQENDFKGANFNGNTQIGEQNITIRGNQNNTVNYQYNYTSAHNEKIPMYHVEPKWRSPITMAILTWFSAGTGLISILSFLGFGINIFQIKNNWIFIPIAFIFLILCITCLWLVRIAEKQIRQPLIFTNYAVNGFGNKLTIEKIHTSKCPECGGKMKYYNKPEQWIDLFYPNGNFKKRKVIKRIPALECTRNSEHWLPVDPAEDRV